MGQAAVLLQTFRMHPPTLVAAIEDHGDTPEDVIAVLVRGLIDSALLPLEEVHLIGANEDDAGAGLPAHLQRTG